MHGMLKINVTQVDVSLSVINIGEITLKISIKLASFSTNKNTHTHKSSAEEKNLKQGRG